MLRISFVALILLSWLDLVGSHRLLLLPLPMRSHTFSFHVIAKELERQGHEVHMILEKTYKVPKAFAENTSVVYHVYGLENKESEVINFDKESREFAKEMMIKGIDYNFMMQKCKTYNKLVSNDMLMFSEGMYKKLEKLKIQAVIVDVLFFMKFTPLVAHRLKAPLILYSDLFDPWVVRTPWLPSIFNPMDGVEKAPSFFKRLSNTLIYAVQAMFPVNPPLDDAVLARYRKYGYFEDEDDLIRNTSLFLWPKDPVLYATPPYTANMIFIGGLTIDFTTLSEVDSDLPREFKEFIEDPNSKGTIVVSFGSMVDTYPEYIAKLFVDTFKRFPFYKFVWRFENDCSIKLTANIMAVKWLPQIKLLSHPSIRLFITHAGNNGQFEAIYHGVPMLSIPLLGDQPGNARRAVASGYGESLLLTTATVDSFALSIKKILNNPQYKIKISKASQILKSQRESPAQRAAYWINHVVDFGADHLRPIGNDLHLFQYLCLDVVIFLQICIVAASIGFVLLLRKLFYILRSFVVIKKHKQN